MISSRRSNAGLGSKTTRRLRHLQIPTTSATPPRTESPVAWWYKNGDRGETYFAIPYVDPETGLEASFYPDYIVRFTDGSIGIYDPKDGATRSAPETFAKSDALQAYTHAHKKLRLRGGIVWKTPGGWRVFTRAAYSLDEDQWELLSL